MQLTKRGCTMSMLQKQAYCANCRRHTLHQKANAEMNKTLLMGHAVISVLTCGLWLPFMIIWAIWHGWQLGRQRFHCMQCGAAN